MRCTGCGANLTRSFVGCPYGYFCSDECHRVYHPSYYEKKEIAA